MGPLCQLILNFSMLLKLNFQNLHLLLHFRILVNELLNMLTLIFQLTWKLDILFHGELRGALELLLVLGQHLDFDFTDVHQHFLTELVNGLSSFLFNSCHIMPMLSFQIINFFFQNFFFLCFFNFVLEPISNVVNLFLFKLNYLIDFLFFNSELGSHFSDCHLVLLIHIQYNLSLIFLILY